MGSVRDIPPCLPRGALCLEAVPKNLKGISFFPALGSDTCQPLRLSEPQLCACIPGTKQQDSLSAEACDKRTQAKAFGPCRALHS